jgi:hypothetical protein
VTGARSVTNMTRCIPAATIDVATNLELKERPDV